MILVWQGHGLSGNAFTHLSHGLTRTFALHGSHSAFLTLQGLQFLNPVKGLRLKELELCPIPI